MKDYTDPPQFAYRRNRCTDDAVLYILENIYPHLEKTGSSVRLIFIDFSSAFNTIQPHLLLQELLNMTLPSSVISWIFDYRTNRFQCVCLEYCHPLFIQNWCTSRYSISTLSVHPAGMNNVNSYCFWSATGPTSHFWSVTGHVTFLACNRTYTVKQQRSRRKKKIWRQRPTLLK